MKHNETCTFSESLASFHEATLGEVIASQRAIGYVRVAAFSLAEPRLGLTAQIAMIRAVAEEHGIALDRVIEDLGESAHNNRRRGLVSLREEVTSGGVDVVIVPELSRLGRNVDDLHEFLKLLNRCGVRLISAQPRVGGE